MIWLGVENDGDRFLEFLEIRGRIRYRKEASVRVQGRLTNQIVAIEEALVIVIFLNTCIILESIRIKNRSASHAIRHVLHSIILCQSNDTIFSPSCHFRRQ